MVSLGSIPHALFWLTLHLPSFESGVEAARTPAWIHSNTCPQMMPSSLGSSLSPHMATTSSADTCLELSAIVVRGAHAERKIRQNHRLFANPQKKVQHRGFSALGQQPAQPDDPREDCHARRSRQRSLFLAELSRSSSSTNNLSDIKHLKGASMHHASAAWPLATRKNVMGNRKPIGPASACLHLQPGRSRNVWSDRPMEHTNHLQANIRR